MGENIIRNFPPLDPDGMEDGCRSELTRTNSDSSGVTVECSHQNADATLSVEWTNEKHNAYLDFLEGSFVQQLHELHCSMGLRRWHSQEKISGPCSSKALLDNTCYSPYQFMVLQDGCWQKPKFADNESLLDNTADSHGILESPWIHRYTSVGKLWTATPFEPQEHSVLCDEGFYLRKDMIFSAEPAGSSEQHPDSYLFYQNSVGSSTEVSDQNFVDEDQRNKSSSRSNAKRLKTAVVDASTDDQIVPSGKLHISDVSTAGHASSEREEQVHHELLSEHPERLSCSKSDMDYFLRGS